MFKNCFIYIEVTHKNDNKKASKVSTSVAGIPEDHEETWHFRISVEVMKKYFQYNVNL